MENIKLNLHEYMNNLSRNGHFNGSVLVAYEGEIFLSQGYGLANVEHGVLNTPKTKFRIGSITKGFTAFAILQLIEKGLLHFETKVSEILGTYTAGDSITIHELLTHTSGIGNFTSFPDYWEKNMRLPSSLHEVLHSFKDLPLEFEPGTNFQYSNSGYILLTAIIEMVSGLSYKEYLERFILDPLNMKNSGCDNGKTILKNVASGYSVWEDTIHTEFIDMSFPLGAFGMYSTVEDLFLWDQSFYETSLLNEDFISKMFHPYSHNYGYGWAVWSLYLNESEPNVKCFSHFGDINGYVNDIVRCVDKKLTAIVLSNNDLTPVMNISRDLVKITLGLPVQIPEVIDPIQVSKDQMLEYVGTYCSPKLALPILLSESNGELYITMSKTYGRKYKYKLCPISRTDHEVIFAAEKINERIVIKQSGNDFELCHIDVNLNEVVASKVVE